MTRLSGPTVIAAGVIFGGSPLLSACGSSTVSSTTGAVASGACTQVGAALSDGPDPDADPIGYAQAQILPLRQLATSNAKLHSAIDGLADAYQAVVDTSNSAASKKEVSGASDTVGTLCPGASS